MRILNVAWSDDEADALWLLSLVQSELEGR